MRNLEDADGDDEPGDARQFRKVLHGAEWVGAGEAELAAVLAGETLGQHEVAIEEVEACNAGRDEEGQARVDLAEQSAEDRAKDEAEAKSGAENAEGAATLFRRGDIGDIGVGDRDGAGEDAGERAAEEQDAERRGEAEDHHVDAEHRDRDQQDRAAAILVGQAAEQRHGEEIGHREDDRQPAVRLDRDLDGLVGQLGQQGRHDRHDQAEGQHVEGHRDHHKQEGILSGQAGRGGHCHAVPLVVAEGGVNRGEQVQVPWAAAAGCFL